MSSWIFARVRVVLAFVLLTVVFAPAAHAVTSTFKILLDLDHNQNFGCDVPTLTGTFQGAERILIVTVDTIGTSAAQVTAVQYQSCQPNSTFSAPAPVPAPPGHPLPWPVGVSNGTGGTSVIESYIPLSLAPIGPSPNVRLAVVAADSNGILRDELVDTRPGNGGGPILLRVLGIVEVPTLSEWGLILLGLVLAAAAVALLRRRRTAAAFLVALLLLGMAGMVWAAATCDLNGNTLGEWTDPPLAVDDNPDTPPAPAGADIRAFFGFNDMVLDALSFRIDALLLFNTPPTANDDAATVGEDSGATAIDVLANDTDPDAGDTFTVASVTQPANGTVVIAPGGTGVSYTPNANYCNQPPGTALDTFTYTLAPGGDTATVTVTVTCVDDDPTAVADAATVPEDAAATAVNVLANDTDPDGGAISIASVTQPANGTVVITGGGSGLTYQPNANYCNSPSGSPDTFTYTLAPGGSSTTVSMTVTCVDDPPTAVADTATVTEDSGANAIDVLANDTDIDAGPKTVASVTQPANGTVVITGGGTGLTYAPNANYCNQPPGTTLDTFTYTLAPGGSSTTVTVTVTCVDDNPVAVADSTTVTEDSSGNAIDVLANDTDVDAGPKSVASVTQPANGTVTITGGGTGVSYTPNANYCNQPPGTSPDTFTYTLAPGGSTATVSVLVTCVDDNPVAVADAATVAEDSGPNAINVLANDTDVDAGPKSVASVTQPANGTVVITGGGTGVSYTPNANYCNQPPGTTLDTFTYTLAPGGSSTTVTVTVTCVDDNPVAVADAATVGEDSGANAINVLANDTDLDGGPKTVAAVTQPANGTVVITGGGTGLSYTPNANYCNTPPGTTLDTFNYSLAPGGSTTTVTVSVTCVDDSPVLDLDANDDHGTTGSNFAVPYTEGDGAKLLEDPLDATVTDVDSANLASLTVTITNLLDTGFETLSADVTVTTPPNAITANYVPATGVLTLTGPTTVANFQAVLRTVKYQNTDVDPDATQPRVINFVANDGNSNSNTATSTVTITAVDTPPTAVNDSATVGEDSGPNAIDVLANDTDPDNGPKSVASVTQPANGTVVITGGGTGVSYTPNANYCNQPPGTTLDTFTYTLSPGSSSATVSVTVTCADDAPVAVADSATVAEDSGANAINVLANDTDVDGGPKSVASVTQPANGTVAITGGGTGVSYTPNANYCNTPPGTTLDTFTYTLTPGSSSTTVTVTVTCVDDNPVAVADATTVVEDSGANAINVLANDTDVDGGPISISAVTQPANGAVVITGGGTGVSYTPNANYCNQPPGTTLDTFTYTLTPGGSSTTVTVTVTCVDDNPVAVADAATVAEDSGANAINVLANDTDVDGGPKSVASVTQPANGTVAITGGGTGVSYTPNANYCNQPPGTTLETFTYTLSPGGSSTTVTVTVTCVDDNPVAVADAATVTEDSGPNAIDVLANDTDIDAGPKSVASVTQPANGAVVITGGGTGLTYAPNANYCNQPPGTTLDTFTYTLSPGGSSTTVTVTVTCVDDNPVAVADSATVVEDSGPNAINVLANDTDVDAGPKSVASVTQPANGTVVITGGGTGVSYTPNANYCNTPPGTTLETFSYTLTPGGSSTTVTVSVTCVDDPPVAVADAATVVEDSGANAINVLANDTDIDAGPKSVASVTQPANGVVVITGGGTGLTYAPNANYCNTPPGTMLDTFTYTLAPGSSSTTVTVSVTCVNDPPVADNDSFDFIGNTELRVDVGTVATPHVLATTPSTFGVVDGDSDPVEGDAIAVSSITVGGCTDSSSPFDCTDATVGTVHMQTNGRFSFEPAPGVTGAAPTGCPAGAIDKLTFTYILTDNGTPAPASSAPATVTLCRFERVWYVDPAGAAGNGTSTSPLNSLTTLNGAGGAGDSDAAGDYIYIYAGSLAGSIELEANQHLLGKGVALSIPFGLNGNASPTNLVAAGTQPQLTNASGDTVKVTQAVPVEIRGLSLASNTGNTIDLTSTAALTGSATLTISSNEIRNAGAEGVDVNLNAGTSGTLALNFTNNTWNLAGTHTGNGFDARTASAAANLRVNFSNNTGILSTGAGASGVFIDGSGGGTMTITGFANNTVHQNTVGNGMLINTAKFDAAPATAAYDQVSGGTTVIGASGNGVGAGGLVMTNVSGDLAFTDLDIFADGGASLAVTGTGAVNVGAGTGTRVTVGIGVAIFEATGGPAVSVSNATIDLQPTTIKSTNSTTTGVALNSVNGTFSAGSGSSISGTSGTGFLVGSSNATVSYAGTVNVTTGSGVSLTSNTGSTIGFTGALTLSTGTNPAFTATGGGTVTTTDTTSTLTTTTGTALNVANTTIGAAGLKFRSISANGAANGITLSATGTSGGLTVSGTGAAGTGGTIQNITNRGASFIDAAGIDLNWMNFTNAATTNGGDPTNASSSCGDLNVGGNLGCNAPVHLVNITGIGGNPGAKLNRLNINGSAQVGININNVTGLDLTNTTLTGIGNQVREFGLKGRNLKGTVTISGVSITGSFGENFRVENSDPSATVTVTGSTFGSSTQGGGFFYLAQDDAQIDVDVSSSSFSSNFTTGLLVGVSDPAATSTCTANLDLTGGPFNNNNAGIQVIGAGAADVTFNIHDIASISGNPASGIALDESDTSTAAGSMVGRIQTNTVTQPLSGSGNGIGVTARGAGTTTIAVTGNTVTNRTQYGIFLHRKEGLSPGTLNATVTGNNVTTTDVNGDLFFPIDGIRVEAGAAAADTGTLCAQISGNTADGAQTAADNPSNFDLKLRHRFGVTYRLPGLVGSTGTDAINLMNTNNPAVDLIDATTTSSYTGGAACPTPP